MKIQLQGFDDVAEARAAAEAFLRETAPNGLPPKALLAAKKKSGPRQTYADSYEPTTPPSKKPRRRSSENSSGFGALLRRLSGASPD